jgi:drug/metabolite transporter (DMT)-like permease
MMPFRVDVSRISVLQGPVFGMVAALLAYWLLAMQDATVKWLVATLPVWQILFVRSAILVLACLAVGGRPLILRASTTRSRTLLILRGAVTLTAWVCYFSAARLLMLGQLVTLYFTAPLIVTLLASPLLGERVGWARWAAVLLGFAGALLAAGPAGLAISPGTLLVLAGACLWAYGVILTRQIARQESSLMQMFWNNCFLLALTGIGSAFSWQAPSLPDIGLLFLLSALGGVGQFCLFESARHTLASVTAPLEYTALIWAFVLGFLVWGDIPRPTLFVAATLIGMAGLWLLLWECKAGPSWLRTQSPWRAQHGFADNGTTLTALVKPRHEL